MEKKFRKVPLYFEESPYYGKDVKPLAKIVVRKADSFKNILKKINTQLNKQGFESVNSFHYLQEDADYAWINEELVDIYRTQEIITTEAFYVTKKYKPSKVIALEGEQRGVEIESGVFRLRREESYAFNGNPILVLQKIEQIYDSHDSVAFMLLKYQEDQPLSKFNKSKNIGVFNIPLRLSTADIAPIPVWFRDDDWIYLRAHSKDTQGETSIELEYSFRVS